LIPTWPEVAALERYPAVSFAIAGACVLPLTAWFEIGVGVELRVWLTSGFLALVGAVLRRLWVPRIPLMNPHAPAEPELRIGVRYLLADGTEIAKLARMSKNEKWLGGDDAGVRATTMDRVERWTFSDESAAQVLNLIQTSRPFRRTLVTVLLCVPAVANLFVIGSIVASLWMLP
jgi:hypothetical protein